MINFKGISPKQLTLHAGNIFLIKRNRNITELIRFGESYYSRMSNNTFQSAKILNCVRSDSGVLHIFYEMARSNESGKSVQEGRFSLSAETFFKSFPLRRVRT